MSFLCYCLSLHHSIPSCTRLHRIFHYLTGISVHTAAPFGKPLQKAARTDTRTVATDRSPRQQKQPQQPQKKPKSGDEDEANSSRQHQREMRRQARQVSSAGSTLKDKKTPKQKPTESPKTRSANISRPTHATDIDESTSAVVQKRAPSKKKRDTEEDKFSALVNSYKQTLFGSQ